MKTTATNRKVRELITSIREKKLVPNPDFQRRLVWNNKDKSAFLETVLMNYPFPEIYVAAGEVDVETGEGKEWLVDGQQRVSTLYQYFVGAQDLILTRGVPPYNQLPRERKEAFLQYDVVVRDLGHVQIDIIRNVFQRINATRYALNAMEIHNSRYEGEYKKFAEEFAQRSFFEVHRIFSVSEIRRMQDMRFVAVLGATVLSTYFNRDEEVEEFLRRFNDEFPLRDDLERELDAVIDFTEHMVLPASSRIWKKADLFTALVELHHAMFKKQKNLDPNRVGPALQEFYSQVDTPEMRADPEGAPGKYYKSTLQATNDRSSRILRGEILLSIIQGHG
jgi:RNAse (barnase) inhibitor barstar